MPTGRHRRRALLLRLVLLATSIVFSLALVEAILRLQPEWLPEEIQGQLHVDKLNRRTLRSVADPYLGFTYRANSEGEMRGTDAIFRYTTDEHGFRNPSPWPSTVDVVAVGDSLVFGFGVPDDRTWAHELAGCLPGGLINLGLPGMGPQQYSRAYEKFGVALRPRVLLYGLFLVNDRFDALDFRDWVKDGSPGNFAVWREHRHAGGSKSTSGLRTALRRSYLFTFLNSMRHRRSIFFRHGRTVRLSGGETIQFIAGEGMNSISREAGDLMMESIESARGLASANSTELLVLLFPTKEDVYLPVLGEPASGLIDAFRPMLEQKGIAYLDLTPVLQAGARRGERVYFGIDGHPNEAGNHAIAAALIERLCSGATE